MYVYALLITYVFNDLISVKNKRKCKKIMFEVRTCKVNDTVDCTSLLNLHAKLSVAIYIKMLNFVLQNSLIAQAQVGSKTQ